MTSLKEKFLALPREKQKAFIENTSEEELNKLLVSWEWTARPQQLPPENYSTWLILAGRGFGKTRTAAETIVLEAMTNPSHRIAVVARSAAEVRDVCIEGVSGILSVAERLGFKAHYESSKRRVTFENGVILTTYTSEEPDQLRGPEHSLAWCDELASWSKADDTMSNLRMGLRLGEQPKIIITTTPKPTKIIIELIKDSTVDVTRGSTFDNKDNLPEAFIDEVKQRYEGTRLGRQELYGEVLEDIEGALFSYDDISNNRVEEAPHLKRIVVAVDPATTDSANSDYTGITVSGVALDLDVYVLHSEQIKLTPNGWANKVLELFDEYSADRIIAERNQGGQMVEHTIRTVRKSAPITTIHASRGKRTRAEPVAALYEQGKVHHVGVHKDLEDQMIVFPVASENDDMVDSLVYSISELVDISSKPSGQFITYNRGKGRRR